MRNFLGICSTTPYLLILISLRLSLFTLYFFVLVLSSVYSSTFLQLYLAIPI